MDKSTSIKSAISSGSSVSWRSAMAALTGQDYLDPTAFVEYFEPLNQWLKEENKRNNVKVGWEVKDYGKFCRREE